MPKKKNIRGFAAPVFEFSLYDTGPSIQLHFGSFQTLEAYWERQNRIGWDDPPHIALLFPLATLSDLATEFDDVLNSITESTDSFDAAVRAISENPEVLGAYAKSGLGIDAHCEPRNSMASLVEQDWGAYSEAAYPEADIAFPDFKLETDFYAVNFNAVHGASQSLAGNRWINNPAE